MRSAETVGGAPIVLSAITIVVQVGPDRSLPDLGELRDDGAAVGQQRYRDGIPGTAVQACWTQVVIWEVVPPPPKPPPPKPPRVAATT